MQNIIIGLEMLGLILFLGLPFLAYKLYNEYDAIAFTLFIILFWMITGFSTVMAIHHWSFLWMT